MVSSLSFLILITCTFFFFCQSSQKFINIIDHFKEAAFSFFHFLFFFLFWISWISFYSHLLMFVLLVFFFSDFLKRKLVSLIWNFSEFIMHTFNAIHSQSTVSRAHQVSDMAYNHFTFIQNMSSISWYYSSHGLFRNMLVNFKVFGNFLDIILLLVSCLILL